VCIFIPFRNALPSGPAHRVLAEIDLRKSLLERKETWTITEVIWLSGILQKTVFINPKAITCDPDSKSLRIHTVDDIKHTLEGYADGSKFFNVHLFDGILLVR